MSLRLFASCAPGVEPWLATEITGLVPEQFKVKPPTEIEMVPGGVMFRGDRQTLEHALVGLGLAARLFVRIAEFPVRHLNEFEKLVARMEWAPWLCSNEPFIVRATSKKSKLYHSGAIEERVLRAVRKSLKIVDQGSKSESSTTRTEEETPCLVVRMEHDICTISLDVSGTPLHRRGYRKNPFRAPLREDLARALVVASGWDGLSTLLDPCCGSGTILMEATLWAQGIPPGCNRSFSIVATSLGNHASLERTKQLRLQQISPAAFSLLGADCDAKALTAAQENWHSWFVARDDSEPGKSPPGQQPSLENLKFVSPTITWVQQDVRQLEMSSGPITIVTNPPWGDRIRASQRLTSVYQGLGELRRSRGVRLALITSQRELAYKTGVRLHSAFLTDAGGIKANVFVE